ncbi:MAG: DinB family protein [Nocardioidaceae bacterium]
MSTAIEVLRDAFGRVHDDLPRTLEGLSPDQVLWRPDADGNSIGWLVWHLSRVQDDHLAGVAAAVGLGADLAEQVWTGHGWSSRFGLPYNDREIGYGHSSDQVGAFSVGEVELLVGYHADVHALTIGVLDGLTEGDLDRVVDERWDPPVTVAVRLVSVVNDITQHLGQVAYAAGMVSRR